MHSNGTIGVTVNKMIIEANEYGSFDALALTVSAREWNSVGKAEISAGGSRSIVYGQTQLSNRVRGIRIRVSSVKVTQDEDTAVGRSM